MIIIICKQLECQVPILNCDNLHTVEYSNILDYNNFEKDQFDPLMRL